MKLRPGTIYLDEQLLEYDFYFLNGSEIYVEPLDRPEPMKHPTQTQVYVRWWHPSSYIVDPTQEIILKNYTQDELKLKVNCPMLPNSSLI